MGRHLASALIGGAAVLGIGSSEAIAQVNQASPSARGLEEVIVTAERRSENVQDVGVAITAFSAASLSERGIDNVASLAQAVPGVKLQEATGGGVPVIIIRGVGLQDFRINNTPTAAVYIDEVYQTSVAQAGFTFFDLERLEILKGPQGGLYGRNTTGGAIQVISRAPDLDERDGYVRLGAGTFETFSGEAAYGAPLIEDKLAVRVAARVVSGREGYTKSLPSGADWGAEQRWGVRGQMLWAPTDNVDVLLKVHGGADTSETSLLRAVGIWAPGPSAVPGIGQGAFLNFVQSRADRNAVCASILAGRGPDPNKCGTLIGLSPAQLGLPAGGDVFNTASNPLNKLDNEWWGASAKVDWDFGEAKLTSVTAYDKFNVGRFTDWDATPLVFQHIDYRSTIESFSQELRLAFGVDRLRFLLGLNYAEDILKERSNLLADTGVVPLAFRTNRVFQPYRQYTTMWAGFGRADLTVSDKLNLIAELRYTDEKKDFAGGTFLVASNSFLVNVDRSASFGDWSGKLAAEFKPTDDVLIYGSISRGYKSGGFFGGFATNRAQLDPYQPETVLAYEVGIKSEWFDRRLRTNASLFRYDYSDLQGFGRETTGVVQIQRLSNIGDAEIDGAELELVAAPTDRLTLSGNVSWLDGKTTSSSRTSADSFGLSTRNSLANRNLPNYSNWSVGGLVQYAAPISDALSLTFQGDFAWRSEQDLGTILIPEEKALFREEGYTLFGARVSLRNEASGWEIAAFGKNLTDETYRSTARTDSFGGFFEVYGAPRTVGVEATLRY